ncbi:hypothetical protein L484_024046 [Morus notabilis]|uniref:Expansin-like CBD domain-containing protein n=1 Tax=Morus notabilis TaxID=981085 RepID=W9RPM5_9ROSA|nr:hypothetical protein L484_024046 [Morus notabilis]
MAELRDSPGFSREINGQRLAKPSDGTKEDCKEWVPMRRAFGAVWDMANPPRGYIELRFQATSSAGNTYWVQSTNAIPENWEAGVGLFMTPKFSSMINSYYVYL